MWFWTQTTKCDSELDCNFPIGLPKKPKTAKKEPPTPPGGVPFCTFSLWMFSHVQRPSLLHGRVLEKQRNQDAACFMRAWHAPLCFILNVQHLNIWQRWNVHGDLHQQWMAQNLAWVMRHHVLEQWSKANKPQRCIFQQWCLRNENRTALLWACWLHCYTCIKGNRQHTRSTIIFSTLQKMPDAKKNSQSQHGRRARREKLGGIQHLVWRCPINCCDAFVHGSKDKTFAEGTRAPWQYSFAH